MAPAVCALVIAFAIPCSASRELIAKPTQVAVTQYTVAIAADTPEFGPVHALIRRAGDDAGRIAGIEVSYGGRTIKLPRKAFGGLDAVFMKTWEIRTERGYGNAPWLYLRVQSPHRIAGGESLPKTITFGFNSGRFKSVSVNTPVSHTSTKASTLDYY